MGTGARQRRQSPGAAEGAGAGAGGSARGGERADFLGKHTPSERGEGSRLEAAGNRTRRGGVTPPQL